MLAHAAKLPYLKIKGTPSEIGFQHGSMLKERVRRCYRLYTEKLIVNPSIDLEEYGGRFLEETRKYFPQYAVEMEALAAGAGMESWQIGVLNARTEIFVKTLDTMINECTTCFFPNRKIFGENWDWMVECEDLVVLLEIERTDGHKLLMTAEPGIIGKIGFNSCGLSVGLNILHGKEFGVGVPVHVLLRAALDSAGLEEIETLFEQTPFCTFSNIMVADDSGAYRNFELHGRTYRRLHYGDALPTHTNHYLAGEVDERGNPMLESSKQRMRRVSELLAQVPEESVGKMKQILLDTKHGAEAICSEFQQHHHYSIGTVCSMIIDLPKRSMMVTRGSPLRHEYQSYHLT